MQAMVMTREVEKISGSLSICSEHPRSHSTLEQKTAWKATKYFVIFVKKIS